LRGDERHQHRPKRGLTGFGAARRREWAASSIKPVFDQARRLGFPTT
jgi:hypothetical protein